MRLLPVAAFASALLQGCDHEQELERIEEALYAEDAGPPLGLAALESACAGIACSACIPRTYWYDADGDLHSPAWFVPVEACLAPAAAPEACSAHQAKCPTSGWGTVPLQRDDCDDNDESRYPGAPEICNRIDDDCSNGDGTLVEPLEDKDGDGFTDETYAQCVGGLPKTDCFDEDPLVYPGQTERFSVGYCLNPYTPIWCPQLLVCAHTDTCANSIGQEFGSGSLDYNCDGREEAFSAFPEETVEYDGACSRALPPDCFSPDAPPYIDYGQACGGLSEYQACLPLDDGTGCAYGLTVLETECR